MAADSRGPGQAAARDVSAAHPFRVRRQEWRGPLGPFELRECQSDGLYRR